MADLMPKDSGRYRMLESEPRSRGPGRARGVWADREARGVPPQPQHRPRKVCGMIKLQIASPLRQRRGQVRFSGSRGSAFLNRVCRRGLVRDWSTNSRRSSYMAVQPAASEDLGQVASRQVAAGEEAATAPRAEAGVFISRPPWPSLDRARTISSWTVMRSVRGVASGSCRGEPRPGGLASGTPRGALLGLLPSFE